VIYVCIYILDTHAHVHNNHIHRKLSTQGAYNPIKGARELGLEEILYLEGMGVPPALELDAARDEALEPEHRLDEGELALVELDPLAVRQHELEVGLGLVEKVAQVCVARAYAHRSDG